MPSKIQVDQIAGATGSTVTLPSGQTLDLSSGTVTLPNSAVNLTTKVTGTLPVANGGTGLTTLGSATQVLRVNSGGTALEFATPSTGTIKQVVFGTDETQYSISTTNSTSDHAASTAFSITPSSTSNKIIINFSIGQIRGSLNSGSGTRIRLYRQIAGGGYSHVTALSGTGSSNRLGAIVGNIHCADSTSEDENRSRTVSMMVVDSPATTSQVDYKIYVGHGDGARTVYINRTPSDSDSNYTSRTRTHVTLMETA